MALNICPIPLGHNNIICCSIMLSDVMHCAEACITVLQLLQYYSYSSFANSIREQSPTFKARHEQHQSRPAKNAINKKGSSDIWSDAFAPTRGVLITLIYPERCPGLCIAAPSGRQITSCEYGYTTSAMKSTYLHHAAIYHHSEYRMNHKKTPLSPEAIRGREGEHRAS